MPEGDTIHKAAARLRPALEGRTIVRFEAQRVAGSKPKPGTTVTAVEAVGKHLLVHFSDGHVLQTHLRMTGRWDLYASGERWRRPAHLARAVIETDEHVAVCFSAPVVHVHRGRPALENVGPDLCLPDVDLDDALALMAAWVDPQTPICDVLLDQRVAAGVGNVFKNEVLWACKVHPLVPLGALDPATRRTLLETAAAQLQANLGPGRRTTIPGRPGSVAVYGRARRSCPRCGTAIRYAKAGATNRSTYWCPTCQPDPP